VLVCPDAFKGTLRASQVAAALGRGLEAAGLEPPDLCPLADGGEGTAEVLLTALGGETAAATVTGPLGDPVVAGYALVEDGGTAIVEVAQASGLALIAPDARDAEAASTRGTGELIAAAVSAGAQVVLVAAGGSATTDGGAGAITAIEEAGGLGGATLVVLCDVRTPFEAAAATFAPQKGARPDAVARLAARLEAFAATLPRDPRGMPLTGAAGGLSGGLWAAYGARLEPGAAFVCDALGLDERAVASRALITGEGRIDATTLEGKVVAEAAARGRRAGRAVHAVVGEDALGRQLALELGLTSVREAGTVEALERAGRALGQALGTRHRADRDAP
jgi:glycerate kinase